MTKSDKKTRLPFPMSKEKFREKLAAALQAEKPAASQPRARTGAPEIGDRMPDGTVFAGLSPDTHQPMYTTPADGSMIITYPGDPESVDPAEPSLTMAFRPAQEYAAGLDAHGHKDWRMPTKAELNVLFNNRAAIGGFEKTGPQPECRNRYWSSVPDGELGAWAQSFSDGAQHVYIKFIPSSVRPVR